MGRRGTAFVALAVVVPVVAATAILRRAPADPPPPVVISEVMTSNISTLVDEDGELTDWIELWNRSAAPIDMTGWSLNDGGDDDSDDNWEFPQLVLASDARLVIFASGKAEHHRLHTNFQLSADGEYLGLRDPKGKTVDEYQTPPLGGDMAYGIGSDGKVGILLAATPGEANSATKPVAVAKPVLSQIGGYIDGAISVTATTATDGAQLWFTTDGSTPAKGHGTQYSGPITVNRTTTLRMVATHEAMTDSFIASATYLVMDDVLAQNGTPLGWSTAPVNGQVYQYGFDQQYVDEHRAEVAASLQAAPTLSITTDLANLVDKQTGIYSNPADAGPLSERPASIELIDGDASFQINGGIRLKGASTRASYITKHGFRLTFGPKYEGPLTFPLFGSEGAQTFTNVGLRAEQNFGWQFGSDRNTMMRDQFVRDSQAAAGVASTRSRWVHLFLNGQYWGLYMLRDYVSAAFAAQLWGEEPSEYNVLRPSTDWGYIADEGNDDQWLKLWDAIEDGVLTDDEYARVAEGVDLSNLATFMLVTFVTGDLDGVTAGTLHYLRANNWQAVGSDDAPFQFFLDDTEYSMGGPDHFVFTDNSGPFRVTDDNEFWEAHNFNPGWLHQVLLTRPEYRAIFRERASVLLARDGALGVAASLARWEQLRVIVDPLVEAEAARWGYVGTQEFGRPEWEAEVAWVETEWIPNRTKIVLVQLRADHVLD